MVLCGAKKTDNGSLNFVQKSSLPLWKYQQNYRLLFLSTQYCPFVCNWQKLFSASDTTVNKSMADNVQYNDSWNYLCTLGDRTNLCPFLSSSKLHDSQPVVMLIWPLSVLLGTLQQTFRGSVSSRERRVKMKNYLSTSVGFSVEVPIRCRRHNLFSRRTQCCDIRFRASLETEWRTGSLMRPSKVCRFLWLLWKESNSSCGEDLGCRDDSWERLIAVDFAQETEAQPAAWTVSVCRPQTRFCRHPSPDWIFFPEQLWSVAVDTMLCRSFCVHCFQKGDVYAFLFCKKLQWNGFKEILESIHTRGTHKLPTERTERFDARTFWCQLLDKGRQHLVVSFFVERDQFNGHRITSKIWFLSLHYCFVDSLNHLVEGFQTSMWFQKHLTSRPWIEGVWRKISED